MFVNIACACGAPSCGWGGAVSVMFAGGVVVWVSGAGVRCCVCALLVICCSLGKPGGLRLR